MLREKRRKTERERVGNFSLLFSSFWDGDKKFMNGRNLSWIYEQLPPFYLLGEEERT